MHTPATDPATQVPTYARLSPSRKRLIAGMHRNPYSRIECLVVRDGEPVFGPETRWIAETKLGTGDPERPESRLADFSLKREHLDLFAQLDTIGTGEILALEIRAGLPFRLLRHVAV